MHKNLVFFLKQFVILGVIVLYSVALVDRDLARDCLSMAGYYFLFLLFVLWITSIGRFLYKEGSELIPVLKRAGLGFVLAGVLVTIIFTSVKPSLRVLSDEANILAVAQSMFYERSTDLTTMGEYYHESFHPLLRQIPKRTMIFPFFISVVHTLTGYRAENVYILNGFLLFILLSAVFLLFSRQAGKLLGAAAAILVAAQPLVVQNATSGGYDLAAAVFLLLSFVTLWLFLKSPSCERLQLLWFTLMITANVRYEGLIFFGMIMAFLTVKKYLRKEFFTERGALLYWLTPFALLPIVWQRLIPIGDFFESGEGASFGFNFFLQNTWIFIKTAFLHFEFHLPTATLVNIIALLGLGFMLYRIFTQKLKLEARHVHLTLMITFCLGLYAALMLAYFRGDVDQPSNSRYYVVFFALLSCVAAVALYQVPFLREKKGYILIIAMAAFALYHPISVKDFFSKMQVLPRYNNAVLPFLKTAQARNPNLLVIAARPGIFTVHNMGGIHFTSFNDNPMFYINYLRRLYEEIYIVQDVLYDTMEPPEDSQLNEDIELETIAEIQNIPIQFIRISRFVMPDKKTIQQKLKEADAIFLPDMQVDKVQNDSGVSTEVSGRDGKVEVPPGMTRSRTRTRTRIRTKVKVNRERTRTKIKWADNKNQ